MTLLVEPVSVRSPADEIESKDVAAAIKPVVTAREIAVALIVITSIVYWNSFAGQFVFDDILQITNNPNVRQLWPLADWQRPLGYLTLQFNYAWGGLQPAGYHAVNLLIHLANGLLLFGIARRCLTLDRENGNSQHSDVLAGAIALLWSVHPLTTSAVTYTVQRLESLMALCFLGVLYCVLHFGRGKLDRRWQLLAMVAMTLGVLTKEVMVTCLPVAILFDRAFVAGNWKCVWQQRRGFYGLLTLPLAWTFITMRMTNAAEYNAGFGYQGVTPWEYLRSQPLVLLHYLKLTFWPDQLLLDYGWPVTNNPWLIVLPGLAILGLLAASFVGVVRYPKAGAVALGAFLVLAPSSSIMPIADLCFEHRMYLPLMAVIALVVLSVDWLLKRTSPNPQQTKLALAALAIVAVALGYRTTQRNADYADPIKLWEKNVVARPHHGRPHLLLAMLYDRSGRFADAGQEYQAAVAANPTYFKGLLNLGGWHFRAGNFQEAAKHFQRAAEVEPNDAAGFTQTGRALLELGDIAGARERLDRALELNPFDSAALRARAWLLATAPDAADRDGEKALAMLKRLSPDPQQRDVWRLDVLATVQAELGQFPQAIETAEISLRQAKEQQRPAELQQQLQQRLDAYRREQPWRLVPGTDLSARTSGD